MSKIYEVSYSTPSHCSSISQPEESRGEGRQDYYIEGSGHRGFPLLAQLRSSPTLELINMLAIIEADNTDHFRRWAASATVGLTINLAGRSDDHPKLSEVDKALIRGTLLRMLQSDNEEKRFSAAKLMGTARKIFEGNPEVTNLLYDIAIGDPNPDVRARGIDSVRYYTEDEGKVDKVVKRGLRRNEHLVVRFTAATVLVERADGDTAKRKAAAVAVPIYLEALDKGMDDALVIVALGDVGRWNPKAFTVLKGLLQKPLDPLTKLLIRQQIDSIKGR